jgi:glucose/arabinose dehydrogenase
VGTTARETRKSLPKLFFLTAVAVAAYASQAHVGDEDPFWAKGRPHSDAAGKMAPVAAKSIPTSADKLPTGKMKLPPGFNVEVWASNVLDARGLRQGAQGTVFVSSLFVAGKVYAIVDKAGKREVKTIAERLSLPSGIEFYRGALYVATPKEVIRFDNIEANLDNPPKPSVIYDKLPGDIAYGWKSIRVGPDGKLYVPIGAPCNICEPSDQYAKIMRMDLDGSNVETVAVGVRHTLGFDWDPTTKDLWFTDNQRDWLSEDLPNDELNHVTKIGQHFGFPYCHQGDIADNEFGWGKDCSNYVKPAALLGPHSAPLGMKFYSGSMFPKRYQGAIFIARHGPWNRTKKYAADVVVAWPDGKGGVSRVEPFLTGLVENNEYIGRPVDLLILKDGSLLVSDDLNGAIYRISYRSRR